MIRAQLASVAFHLAILVFSPATLSAQEVQAGADEKSLEIIEACIKSMGGRQALEEIKTLKIKTFNTRGDQKKRVGLTQVRGRQVHVENTGGYNILISNGRFA